MKLDLTRGGAPPARGSSGAWRTQDSWAHMLPGRAVPEPLKGGRSSQGAHWAAPRLLEVKALLASR
eukprot:5486312-Alexandrium_andersonii.AAC.1